MLQMKAPGSEGVMQTRTDAQHGIEVALHHIAKAGQCRPHVVGPGRAVGPEQVEGFLVVGGGLFVQRLDAETDIATVAAEQADRHRLLDLRRHREETCAVVEGIGNEFRRHPMAGDHEKTGAPAGGADLLRDDLPCTRVV